MLSKARNFVIDGIVAEDRILERSALNIYLGYRFGVDINIPLQRCELRIGQTVFV